MESSQLERSPQVQVELADRLNASLDIVTDAVRFACFTDVLTLTPNGRLQLGGAKLKKSAVGVLDDAAAQAVKRSERLGFWFAMAGSTRNVFDVLGLTA